jgi:MSHA biogenesis protein MshO
MTSLEMRSYGVRLSGMRSLRPESCQPSHATQAGFSLLEIIVVIVIIAILGVSVTRFMTQSVSGYLVTAERQRMALSVSAAGEQIARSLAEALPNSIRVGGNCLEWIPVLARTFYESVPITLASSAFEVLSSGAGHFAGGHAVVNPSVGATLYQPGNAAVLSAALASLPDGADGVMLTLSAAHRFLSDSPNKQLFLTGSPESYCSTGSLLVHHRGYGFNVGQVASPSAGSRAVMLTGLEPGSLQFRYAAASSVSGERVSWRFSMAGSDADRVFEQEVHLRYVP